MPRPYSTKVGSRAGQLLLDWAKRQPEPHALDAIAEACEVNPRTVKRWIEGDCEPTISAAFEIKRISKVPLGAWKK